jgi:hypothetical protein
MPQENLRTESPRSEATRAERPRERAAAAAAATPPFGEVGERSVNAGLRMQHEMADVFSEISREWFARATSKAELAMKLPSRLSSARSVPDALSAYQEWLGEWMTIASDDSRRFVSDSQKIMDAGTRCFAAPSPVVTS